MPPHLCVNPWRHAAARRGAAACRAPVSHSRVPCPPPPLSMPTPTPELVPTAHHPHPSPPEYLELHPNVDPAISPRCVLAEFSPAGPQLSFRVRGGTLGQCWARLGVLPA